MVLSTVLFSIFLHFDAIALTQICFVIMADRNRERERENQRENQRERERIRERERERERVNVIETFVVGMPRCP